jgi:hypothetical protein
MRLRSNPALAALSFALHLASPSAGCAQAAPPPQPIEAAAPRPASPLDAAGRRMVVDSVAKVLEARYADSAGAVRLAAHLRARHAAGAYDSHTAPADFGVAIMRDLQSVIADKHLRISYEPDREYTLMPAGGPSGASPGGAVRWNRIDGRDSATIARTNFAFDAVERLPGNIGYLRLSQFVPLDYSRETAVAAMAFLANSDAVIVDLRDNVGGSPELVELILSYFFDPDPVTLLTTYGRFAQVTTERRTLREVPGRRMPRADLYVLTSGNSASSAEMFAYAVQQTRRGTVVGETTAGAGNGGAKLSVGFGLALFVPQFQVINGPGFERTGVTPDVAAPREEALEAAHRLAVERLAAVAEPRVKAERAWALELLLAQHQPIALDAAELARYAGSYGTRTIRVEGSRLVSVGSTGWKTPLVPLGSGVFRAREERLRFQTDSAGMVQSVTIEAMSGTTITRPRQ